MAGTNGKGSTVAYLAAMSAGMGQRCGTYTSPHLLRFNERICVAGEPVTDATLLGAFERVEVARKNVSLTYFEFTTLAAFVILQQSSLDFAVLEVGLGGRLDTVNLVDTDCAVITAIGLDHQDYLGPDVESIAAEKAGIMRPDTVVVCSARQTPAVILQTAHRLGAHIYRPGTEFNLIPLTDQDTVSLRFSMGDVLIDVAMPRMQGQHQVDNLAGALAAFFLLNPEAVDAQEEISSAIRLCEVSGRMQRVGDAPVILLDVGHNALAARAVAAQLRAGGVASTACVIAMLADKPVEMVARALDQVCRCWICVDSHGDRGQRGARLAKRIQAVLPETDVSDIATFSAAIEKAIDLVGEDGTVLVFGSFSVVADATRWLQNRIQHGFNDAAKMT